MVCVLVTPAIDQITYKQVIDCLFSWPVFLTVLCWCAWSGNNAPNWSFLLLWTHFWQGKIDLIKSVCERLFFWPTQHSHSLSAYKQITLRDLRSFKTEHEFDAFSGSLSDFDVHGNLLAACGFSSRGMNGLACDRFLMVYDLRMMRAVTPLQVHVDPLFLRFIPTYTSRLAIISQTGISRGMWGHPHTTFLSSTVSQTFFWELTFWKWQTIWSQFTTGFIYQSREKHICVSSLTILLAISASPYIILNR